MQALCINRTLVIMDDIMPWLSWGKGPTKAWKEAIHEGVIKQEDPSEGGMRVNKMTPRGDRGSALGRYILAATLRKTDSFADFPGRTVGVVWCDRVNKAVSEMTKVVAPGDAFILVDQDQWTTERLRGRLPIPFLERDGKYWGDPADDGTAICEMERIREAGAKFIVFGWPAFWWFNHYLGFDLYLRSQFRCALKTNRVVVFDLRPDANRHARV